MTFTLRIRRSRTETTDVPLSCGQILFILGANGSGKSSLVGELFRQHHASAKRISAHRQTWFSSNAVSLSAQQKRQTEENVRSTDAQPDSRWQDRFSAQRAGLAIYELVDAENVRARAIAAAVDQGVLDTAAELSKEAAPLKKINALLRQSNIPVELSIHENEEVRASKRGGPQYSIAELSDGERNALLIAADVLTAPTAKLIIIDEPERHLHQSIVAPLLTELFALRPDCAFVVSTHELPLQRSNKRAKVLLVRECQYRNKQVEGWEVDLLESPDQIDESIRLDILGARSKILFIEGTEQSLDQPLYSLIFPDVSVVPKDNCRAVELSVVGTNSSREHHWVHAFGIVDNDARAPADLARLESNGIFPLPYFSVESIYYHPDVQMALAGRQSNVLGLAPDEVCAAAIDATVRAVTQHVARLSRRVAEKEIREEVLAHLPTSSDIEAGQPITLAVDTVAHVAREEQRLNAALAAKSMHDLVARYPLRETPALDGIARTLGFQGRAQYEQAVRKWLADEHSARVLVRSLFGGLASALGIVDAEQTEPTEPNPTPE